jgi:hypothetical protein
MNVTVLAMFACLLPAKERALRARKAVVLS